MFDLPWTFSRRRRLQHRVGSLLHRLQVGEGQQPPRPGVRLRLQEPRHEQRQPRHLWARRQHVHLRREAHRRQRVRTVRGVRAGAVGRLRQRPHGRRVVSQGRHRRTQRRIDCDAWKCDLYVQ